MSKITTIKLDVETKQRLDHLKEHKRETYEEVIKKILFILNKIRKDPLSANRFLSVPPLWCIISHSGLFIFFVWTFAQINIFTPITIHAQNLITFR